MAAGNPKNAAKVSITLRPRERFRIRIEVFYLRGGVKYIIAGMLSRAAKREVRFARKLQRQNDTGRANSSQHPTHGRRLARRFPGSVSATRFVGPAQRTG